MTLSNMRGLNQPVRSEREAVLDRLNARYRAEGWPAVTDAALKIDPVDVESQARSVAAWAHARIAQLEAQLSTARQTVRFFASVIKSGERWTPAS